jgi:hypothetical protein
MKQGSRNSLVNIYREAFLAEWRLRYPEILPIRALLNNRQFPNCWMRIHSLPLSKRYPDTKAEWDILLSRQNALIDYLVPQATAIRIVINWIERDNYLFKSFKLEPLGIFQEAEGEPEYDSFLMETTWESHTENPLLMMIADESLQAFIIASDCLIKPYDGGVDVILKDPHTCYALKRRFKDWLSKRPDGL